MKAAYKSPASVALRLNTEGMMAISRNIGGNTGGGDKRIDGDTQVLSGEGNGSSTVIWNNADN